VVSYLKSQEGELNEVNPLKPRIALFGDVYSLSELLDDIDGFCAFGIAEFVAGIVNAIEGWRRDGRAGRRTDCANAGFYILAPSDWHA